MSYKTINPAKLTKERYVIYIWGIWNLKYGRLAVNQSYLRMKTGILKTFLSKDIYTQEVFFYFHKEKKFF